MTIEFPPRRHPSMAGSLDMAVMAEEAAASATSAEDKATFTRIAYAARRGDAVAMSPQAEAAFGRAMQAFQEHDAGIAVRTAEIQGALNRNIERLVPSAAPITNSSFSLVHGRLPDWMQAILEHIDDQLDEVRAVRRNLTEELQAIIQERGEVVSKIKIGTDAAAASRYGVTILMQEGHPDLTKLRAEQSKLDKRLEKINAKLADSQPRFADLDKLQERCRIYIRQILSQAQDFVAHDGKPAKKQAITDLKKAIADTRQEIAELFADLRELYAKPRPSTEVKRKVREMIEATAKPPRVLGAIDHGDAILWPIVGIRGNQYVQKELVGSDLVIPPEAYSIGGTADALGVLCFAFKDTLITAIDAEVDKYSDDANAITDDERALGEAELRAKIILLERDEEQLVRLAEERELPIHRRGDADPRVVLGLASNMPAMAE